MKLIDWFRLNGWQLLTEEWTSDQMIYSSNILFKSNWLIDYAINHIDHKWKQPNRWQASSFEVLQFKWRNLINSSRGSCRNVNSSLMWLHVWIINSLDEHWQWHLTFISSLNPDVALAKSTRLFQISVCIMKQGISYSLPFFTQECSLSGDFSLKTLSIASQTNVHE